MKIVVPDYYKYFKCIAGACEDTCCAGWEVDVDEDSFQHYKCVEGELGRRLRDVMILGKEGEGCTFRLTPDKRCPFLNEKNLCDIYTELGEEALCETCTNFPRFVHDYGAVREIGPAPSCFTAAQLMVGKKGETRLESHEDMSIMVSPNDIDPESFFMLKAFREEAFRILWGEVDSGDSGDAAFVSHKGLVRILELANEVQDKLPGGLKAGDELDCTELEADKQDILSLWLAPFPGMEVINGDWNELLAEHDKLREKAPGKDDMKAVYEDFKANVTFAEDALKQLLFYYLFRYVLEAVHDGRLLCAVKTAAVAYLSVKRLCVSRFYMRGGLTKDEMADIFHLYSRQIEHSDVNFEYYREAYDTREEYRLGVILDILRCRT